MADITLHTQTVGEHLRAQGISRRGFLKFCGLLASSMALAPSMIPKIAEALENAKRPSVIWLSFQECTGCTESITRSHSPSIEGLIFDAISLDYHHTLQAASGDAAEHAREEAMKEHYGKYVLVVDGSIPLDNPGYSTIAGISNLDMLKEAAAGAAAIVAVGTCSAYGGLPKADPNPTGAVSVSDIIKDKPIINVPGCPPIPVVITGVIAHFLTFGLPELDSLGRPKAFYGQNIHDRCYRRPFYERGLFAETFDDEGAKAGWCLYKLGCKGPVTYNACATTKWNGGTSFPIQSGHGCLGCSEPGFWDFGGLYRALPIPTGSVGEKVVYAAAAGIAAGVAIGALNKKTKSDAVTAHKTVTVEELNQESQS
ncbi:MAG TPA: hydrogenase small subunit [Candidatus Thiothrix moscowensis]|uniref:hydrogenase small subunit n=1 Tax=unclassified Thiothrix TaxID=2636184 RepID=UPI0025F4A995|nr:MULTISPECIES: hydrogenase small subunit [unclassified Thiothrix]HRJ52910.1 hydrogenase small subunit [Candidatus Thiothrix moscowensis]HRJ93460.1 hydrogenase small subunit [Candidatus Thiothrix moscowensis]